LIYISRAMKDILVVINLYYYQFKGFHLFEVLMKYQMKEKKYKIIILLTFLTHLVIEAIYILIYLTFIEPNIVFANAVIYVLWNLFVTITQTAIHFITCGIN
jgi:fatty acid desaturase